MAGLANDCYKLPYLGNSSRKHNKQKFNITFVDSSVSVNVSTNITTGELCITSLPDGCYTTTVYNTTIYDVTGYYVNTANSIQDGVCTQLDELSGPSSECLPYLVEVDAYNPLVLYSETITHRAGEGECELCSECVYPCNLIVLLNLHNSIVSISRMTT